MNQVRIHGDPFGDDRAACLLRSFVRVATASDMRCALSLAAVEPRPPTPGQRAITLTDGVRDLVVGTHLPPAEIELLMRAAERVVAATAPVLVFAPASARTDAVLEAGLAWPRAAAVLPARDGTAAPELLERVRAELRWAGEERPPHSLDERELAPWLALPPAPAGGPVVCLADDAGDDGVDLAIAAWREHFAALGVRMRIVVADGGAAARERVLAALGPHAAAAAVELAQGAFAPVHVADAAAVLLPRRAARSTRAFVQALASGRPVVASRWAATAPLLDAPGTCVPIGGRNVPQEGAVAAHFAPHPSSLRAALHQALADAAAAAAMGRRARAFVVAELAGPRPAAAPPPVPAAAASRPVIVLQAPLLETSSSAELTIETARALCRRGRVDVRLVVDSPMRQRVAWLRARAPELESRLCRHPGDVDLWLASGWPVRASRPACRTFALRVDQEYGTLPHELTPHVTQDADVVVAHSEHVYRTLTAAGRPMGRIQVIPHGVDASMHDGARPDERILAWKQHRPAVLFCGGLIWRKGFDVFLRAVLAAQAAGRELAVVVKTVGQDQHYGRFHLGELLRRFRATAGTPPVLVVDGELSRTELAGVYTACDLMLHPYRGEGFCLPVLEARACGLPVLATGGGATDAMMAGPGAARIPSVRRSVDLPGAHVAAPWVLEPSADDASRLLIEALDELPALQHAARAFAPRVRDAYTWDAAAGALEELAFAAAGKRRGANAPELTIALPPPPPRHTLAPNDVHVDALAPAGEPEAALR